MKAALSFAYFLLVLGLVVGATVAFYESGPNCPDGAFRMFYFKAWHCVPEVGRTP